MRPKGRKVKETQVSARAPLLVMAGFMPATHPGCSPLQLKRTLTRLGRRDKPGDDEGWGGPFTLSSLYPLTKPAEAHG